MPQQFHPYADEDASPQTGPVGPGPMRKKKAPATKKPRSQWKSQTRGLPAEALQSGLFAANAPRCRPPAAAPAPARPMQEDPPAHLELEYLECSQQVVAPAQQAILLGLVGFLPLLADHLQLVLLRRGHDPGMDLSDFRIQFNESRVHGNRGAGGHRNRRRPALWPDFR